MFTEDFFDTKAYLPPLCQKIDVKLNVKVGKSISVDEFRDYILSPNISRIYFDYLKNVMCYTSDQTLMANIRAKVRGACSVYSINDVLIIQAEKIPLIEDLYADIRSLSEEDKEKWFKFLKDVAPAVRRLSIRHASPEVAWDCKVSFPKLWRLGIESSVSVIPSACMFVK
jgi:hypothetical protein